MTRVHFRELKSHSCCPDALRTRQVQPDTASVSRDGTLNCKVDYINVIIDDG